MIVSPRAPTRAPGGAQAEMSCGLRPTRCSHSALRPHHVHRLPSAQEAVDAATLALPPSPRYTEAASPAQFTLAIAKGALAAFDRLALREEENLIIAKTLVWSLGDWIPESPSTAAHYATYERDADPSPTGYTPAATAPRP
ncbi:hypothetical protein T492DRAFT_995678 [Pavlovales sp. CCMP2436]|nr:hypothetical protein T492DRAFT_995678 [Pavlovales sp. CCMP2436]